MNEELRARIAQGERELVALDAKLGELIKVQAPIVREPRLDYFWSLARSIIGQQVSVASASAIFARLEAATELKPKQVLELADEQWRAIGVSRQKERYVRDLAQRFADNRRIYEHLERLEDEAVIAELVAVKGIGVWTAQMFLIVTLVRLDVFAPDDIGLQRAMKLLYGWETMPPRAELEAWAERWRPWRTIASWHLWASLNNSPG